MFGEDIPEEILDIVDEDNRVIGREKRNIEHQSGLWRRGVHIFLFTPQRQLIIQRRGKRREESPTDLDCSVSEHLKVGEGYLDAAIRGLREELGIERVPLQRLVRLKMNYGPGDNMISVLYEGMVDEELITVDPNEVEQIIHHSTSELGELLTQEEISFSRWFKQLLLWYLGRPSGIQIIEEFQER